MTPDQAKGYCNLRHHEALGYYPAQHARMERGKMDLGPAIYQLTKERHDLRHSPTGRYRPRNGDGDELAAAIREGRPRDAASLVTAHENRTVVPDLVKYLRAGIGKAGPHGFTHGWVRAVPEGTPSNDRKTADKMPVGELRRHLENEHSGNPVIGQRVGPKKLNRQQLIDQHEHIHNVMAQGGFGVAYGLAHTHGMPPAVGKVGPHGYEHGWIKVSAESLRAADDKGKSAEMIRQAHPGDLKAAHGDLVADVQRHKAGEIVPHAGQSAALAGNIENELARRSSGNFMNTGAGQATPRDSAEEWAASMNSLPARGVY
jgi:hypothetical protein